MSEKPDHLIDPRFASWHELLLAAADDVLADATKGGARLSDYTWGRYNTTHIQHPLSLAVPALASWLDMPPQALAGDSENMPRIQGPAMALRNDWPSRPAMRAKAIFTCLAANRATPCRPITAMPTMHGPRLTEPVPSRAPDPQISASPGFLTRTRLGRRRTPRRCDRSAPLRSVCRLELAPCLAAEVLLHRNHGQRGADEVFLVIQELCYELPCRWLGQIRTEIDLSLMNSPA